MIEFSLVMSDLISFADFTRMDIRVGRVVKVEVPSGSAHVYRLTISFGPAFAKASGGKERIIFSGLKQSYEIDELMDKQVVCMVNLEPKKVMGEESQGMLLAVDSEKRPVLIVPAEKVVDGSRIR